MHPSPALPARLRYWNQAPFLTTIPASVAVELMAVSKAALWSFAGRLVFFDMMKCLLTFLFTEIHITKLR